MKAISFPIELFRQADARALRCYLLGRGIDTNTGLAAMSWLLEQRPEVANELLCLLYDVACYRVGQVFGELADSAEKWFASVPAESDMDIEQVPYADTESQAHAAAVSALRLREKFFGLETAAAVA